MDSLKDTSAINGFTNQKGFEVTNPCNDLMAGSRLLSESTKDVLRGESFHGKICCSQKQRILIKNILQQDVFKLKQHYQTLRTLFKDLVDTVSNLFVEVQFEINQKAGLLLPQVQLQRAILEMKQKVSTVQVSNRILTQQNEKMLVELEALRVAVSQGGYSDNRRSPGKERQREALFQPQFNQQQRMPYLDMREEQGIKARKHDSRQSFRTFTNPDLYPQPTTRELVLGIQRTNISSPMVRQSESSRVYGTKSKSGSFTSTPIRQEGIPEEQKSKLVTRKLGTSTTFSRPTRQAINIFQLESRLDTMKKELANEIRSAEKRRF